MVFSGESPPEISFRLRKSRKVPQRETPDVLYLVELLACRFIPVHDNFLADTKTHFPPQHVFLRKHE